MVREDEFFATLQRIFDEKGYKNIASISCREIAEKMKITTKEVRSMALKSRYCPTVKGKLFSSFLVVIY